MDYYKYIKYKTKYLNLKYGGGIVPCDKAYKNTIGTCWAVGLQMILSSGHLTSDQLNETMNSFQKGDGYVTAIKENSEKFIEQQIKKIQSNTELTNAFAHYNIFVDDKIVIVKDILRTFIERYYNKFMNIQFTPKPLEYIDPEIKYTDLAKNKERCEYRMAEDFRNLFDFSHIKKRESEFGEFIYGQYLFCNLLSIFFLDCKVSFRNYYDNFNKIIFNDENDLGILIHINKHVCCLFICNGEEKFYNDNDKQIYNCKWKDLLQQGTTGKQLYIIKGCLEFIDDIKTYKGNIKKISKVFYLTIISKHTKEDTTLDIDIKKLLEFTELDKIKDMEIQELIGEYYDNKHQFDKAWEFYDLAADQGYYISQFNFGIKLYYGQGGDTDLYRARTMFKLAADQGFVKAQYNVGMMSYTGEGGVQDYVQAREYFKLAADQGYANAQYELGKMLYYGEGGKKNIIQAKYMFELAAGQNHADALYRLGMMLYNNGEGSKKNIRLAREKFESGAVQNHADAQYRLGMMSYNGEGGKKNIRLAKYMFELAAEQNHAGALYMLGMMLYNDGYGSKKNIRLARKKFELAAVQNHAGAQYMLGLMFYKGDGGVQNIIQARKKFELAAEQNHADALYMLGMMFYYGNGGDKDIDQARIKLELAAKQGHEHAKFKLEVMF
jgi:TPR repeat protein